VSPRSHARASCHGRAARPLPLHRGERRSDTGRAFGERGRYRLEDTSRASDKFMHGITVLMAKNYVDNLSEEVKKGQREKAEQAYCQRVTGTHAACCLSAASAHRRVKPFDLLSRGSELEVGGSDGTRANDARHARQTPENVDRADDRAKRGNWRERRDSNPRPPA
jgi:hypothetical protein